MKPKIGQIVEYIPTQEDENYMGNTNTICNKSKLLPAVIVAVWGDTCVNLKVFLDGVGELWRTSSIQGNLPGQWHFME